MTQGNGGGAPSKATTPVGINHVVLNVRDIEESHRFWTEVVGLEQVGTLKQRSTGGPGRGMRFYSGRRDGLHNHHDLALIEMPELPPPPAEDEPVPPMAIAHVALTLPSREAWLEQLAFMQRQGVKLHRRVDHGMTHSVYIRDPNGYGVELLYELPREVWEGDIDAALNYAEVQPTEGPEALRDAVEGVPVFGKSG